MIRTLTFSVFCVCLSWGGTFGLLVVYANRALHLTQVDVRLGLLYSAGELGGLLAAVAVPTLIKRLAIGPVTAAFMAVSAASLAFLAVAPSYDWALLAFFLFELAYVIGDHDRHHRPADADTRPLAGARQHRGQDDRRRRPSGRSGSWRVSSPRSLPIRLTFGLLTISAVVGAGLAGWSCLGSRPLAAVSVAAPAVQAEGVASLGTVRGRGCPVAGSAEAGLRHPAHAGHSWRRSVAVPGARRHVSRVAETYIRHIRLLDKDRNLGKIPPCD